MQGPIEEKRVSMVAKIQMPPEGKAGAGVKRWPAAATLSAPPGPDPR